MDRLFLWIYIAISIILGIIDLYIAAKSYRKKGVLAYNLGVTAGFAFLVDITYLLSILAEEKIMFSAMSSLYFISIDFMLIALLQFIIDFTRNGNNIFFKNMLKVFKVYSYIETLSFASNPFHEIAVGYELSGFQLFSRYVYKMHPLFYAHLAFTYLLVVIVFIFLIQKCVTVPVQYRNQYSSVLISIIVVVLVNAVFLFTKTYGINIYNVIDYSICGYSVGLYAMFWSCFQYSEHDMLKGLSKMIFDDLDQGVVLFDYENMFVMNNEKTSKMMKNITFSKSLTLDSFKEMLHLNPIDSDDTDFYTVQCYLKDGEEAIPYRCDYRMLKDRRNAVIGNLFVFTNINVEIDLLTGFHTWESFLRDAEDESTSNKDKYMALVCDINGLSVINNTHGREYGNQKIRELSTLMKEVFPKESYFVRGRDAHLIVIVPGQEDVYLHMAMKSIERKFDGKFQYGISVQKAEKTVAECVSEATRAMMTKKLLDLQSIRSQILNTLVKAMQQTDSDTEAHVKRTQLLGSMLGKRIGLSDMDQGNLSLLCLMHDIGKIGIPLEILNKPGKITSQEWMVLQSHVTKGYQIAISSPEYEGIADMILHHHERWDGKGYPDGIEGENIPLLSRIIAVVDAYDAMVNDRPYRKGRPSEDAKKELLNCAGTQFDPYIVEEFIKMIDENPSLERRHQEEKQGEDVPIVSQEVADFKDHFTKAIDYSRYIINNHGMIMEVDDMFEMITGYSKEDVERESMSHFQLIPSSDFAQYQAILDQSLKKGVPVYLQHRIQRKDNTIIVVVCFGRRYYDSAANEERNEIIITKHFK